MKSPDFNNREETVRISETVKPKFLTLVMVMLAVATAQQQPSAHATIYGTVIRQDGEPARRIALEAQPLGVYEFAGVLPRTETNDAGQYRFQGLPWWDRYTVYAEDEKAGYSRISTGPAGDSHPAQVEITPQQPKAEFNFTLPRKAGFIQIKLRNRRSSEIIRGMVIEVMTMEKPDSLLFSMSCYSNHVLWYHPTGIFYCMSNQRVFANGTKATPLVNRLMFLLEVRWHWMSNLIRRSNLSRLTVN